MNVPFERFTDRARRAVWLADQEARALGHDVTGTGHLLLGLLAEGEAVAFRALDELGVTIGAAREAVRELTPEETAVAGRPGGRTPRAAKALELAVRESLLTSCSYVAAEHLLLALARQEGSTAYRVLTALVPGHEAGAAAVVRQKVLRILLGYQEARARTVADPPLKPLPEAGGMSQAEFERRVFAPQRRWEQYQLGDPAGLEKAERQRLKDAAEVVRESTGVNPELVADVIAALVLRRELWEPDLREF